MYSMPQATMTASSRIAVRPAIARSPILRGHRRAEGATPGVIASRRNREQLAQACTGAAVHVESTDQHDQVALPRYRDGRRGGRRHHRSAKSARPNRREGRQGRVSDGVRDDLIIDLQKKNDSYIPFPTARSCRPTRRRLRLENRIGFNDRSSRAAIGVTRHDVTPLQVTPL